MLRNVTDSQKKRVAGRQRFKCAASIPDYTCPLKGEPFDESGYDIDHIKELRDGGSNDLSNLQALCISCHRVKTTRNTSSGIKQVEAIAIPTREPIKLCHHCHDQHNDQVLRKEHDKWFCHMHNVGSCRYVGCLGKETVHVTVVSRIDPPGTVRSSWTTPDRKVWHSVTFPRKI